VDLTHQPVRRGDTLILCSDGLSGVVRREEFAQMAQEHPDLAALCSALIDLANSRGGPDNITVVAARFEGEGLPEDGTRAVGHHRYHLEQVSTPNEALAPVAEEVQQHEQGSGVVPENLGGYAPPPDVMRTVALILVTVGVFLLLLAVWQ
jgi:protein phosphatase